MPIFGKGGPKNPQELVKGLNDALSVLRVASGGAKKADKVSDCSLKFIYLFYALPSSLITFFPKTFYSKACEEASKLLQQMKVVLYGSGGMAEPSSLVLIKFFKRLFLV